MFASQNSAWKMAEEFAAKQRAKELATKGHSKIAAPTKKKKKVLASCSNSSTNSGSIKSGTTIKAGKNGDDASVSTMGSATEATPPKQSKWLEEKNAQRKKSVLAILQEEILLEEMNKNDVIKLIRETSEVAKVRLGSGNKMGAILSMKKIKKHQAAYHHRTKLIKGLDDLAEAIESGKTSVDEYRAKKKAVLAESKERKLKMPSNEELLAELQEGELVPDTI